MDDAGPDTVQQEPPLPDYSDPAQQPSEFGRWIAQQQKAAASAAILQQNNPDQAGRGNQLGRDFNLPADTAQRQAAKLIATQQAQQAQALIDQHPATGQWLSDPRNAAVASDDLGNVRQTARAVAGAQAAVQQRTATAPTLWNSLKGVFNSATSSLASSIASLNLAETDWIPNSVRRPFGIPLMQPLDSAASYTQQRAQAQAQITAARPAFQSTVAGKVYDAASSVAQAIPSVAAGIFGGPAAGVAAAVTQFGGDAYGKYRTRGATRGQAALGGTLEGATAAIGEMLPLGYLTSRLTSAGARPFIAGFVARDVGSIEAQIVANKVVDTAIANPDKTWSQAAGELPEEMASGLLTAGMFGSIAAGAHMVANRLAPAEQAGLQAADQANTIDKLMTTAAQSKVRARDPEAFSNLIAGLTKDTPTEHLYVPAEAAASYFQSHDIDYHNDSFWGDYADQIDDGLHTGGDVVVPTSEAAAHLAGTPAWDALKNDTRASPGGASLSEAQAFEADRTGNMEKLGASMADQFQADRDAAAPRDQITDDIRQKLMNAGYRPDQAQLNADLVASRYTARADRLGQPLTGDETSHIDVNRVLPEKLAPIVAADGLDQVIGAMRRGNDVKPDNGPSLLQFISKRGGIDDAGGDLADMGASDWHKGKPGTRKLIRRSASDIRGADAQGVGFIEGGASLTGHGIDDHLAAAREAGYFPELQREGGDQTDGTFADKPDQSHLLDAMREELHGSPRYAAEDHSVTLRTREAAEELRTLLERDGLDPAKVNRREINAALDRYRAAEAGGYQQNEGDGPRGQISFVNGRSVVQLFESSNLSTFVHEMGHNWLEELRQDATAEGAPEQLKADYAAVTDWFAANGHSVGEDGAIPTDAHELWARGFERYLLEGKAPSSLLRRAFEHFRGWMLHIYKTVQRLGAPITPEIRDVMDRMLATDGELANTRERQSIEALFKDATAAGMSAEEFSAYQRATADARDTANEMLLKKTMATVRAARTKEWKDEERGVRDDVTQGINDQPGFKALHLLRTGKILGDAAGDTIRAKLDKQWLTDAYGADVLKDLPGGVPPIYSDRETMDADAIAEMTGFKSGDEMVRQLLGMEQAQREMRTSGDKRTLKARLIDDATINTMRDRHGDALTDGSIEEEALAAVHNERQGEVISAEMRALNRKRANGDTPTPYSVAKDWAARTVAEGVVRDVLSGSAIQRYARAAAKAGRGAEAAMLKGDVDETYRQKQRQLLNNALVGEAGRVKEEIDSAVKRMGKYAKAKTLKSMDQDYLDQIHGLLEDIDLRPRTAALERERAGFEAWAKAKEDAGEEVKYPPRLAVKDGYQSMKVEELRGLADTVDSIAHLGRRKKEMLVRGQQRAFAELKDELTSSAEPLPDRKVSQDAVLKPSAMGRVASELTQINSIARELDAKDPNGPWTKIFVYDATDAANEKARLTHKVLDPLATMFNEMSKDSRRRIHDRLTIDELPLRHADGSRESRVWRRADLLLMALHTGTESSLDKMERGEGWDRETIDAVLQRELTADDWQFVDKAWKQVGTLWPDIARVERELSGVVPEKLDPRTVSTPFGDLDGGYWPISYDPMRSEDAANLYKDDGSSMFGQHGRAVSTPKGHTVERTGYAGPIAWSLERSLFNHLDRVTTRIAYGRYVRDTLKVIRDPKVRETIIRKRGESDYRQLEPWLQGQVNNARGDTAHLSGMEAILKQFRIAATVVGLGFRITTTIQHVAYLFRSMQAIGVGATFKGVGATIAHPKANADFVFSRSAEMRDRAETFDQNVREAFAQMGTRFNGKPMHDQAVRTQEFSQKWAFWAMGKILLHTVAMPTWLGAYQKAIHEGMTDEDASRYSDDAVTRAQGGGRAKDLTSFQRGGEFARQLGMFYSAFAPLVNRQREMLRGTSRVIKGQALPGDAQEAVMTAFLLLVAEPAAIALFKGQGPAQDESWEKWALRKSFFNLWTGIPVARDIASAGERIAEGKTPLQAAGQSEIPIAKAIASVIQVGADGANTIRDGTPPDNWVQHAVETPGYFFALPTGQPAATAQFAHDLATGKSQPKTASDYWTGVTKGRLPK